jgi:alkyl sulfatase BDS1-like metallo-beta-lactamase superfamily hydrolase
MGGADAVIRHAREDFKNGDYRFVAEVVNKVIFAEPTNIEARDLLADAFEQLGYLAESATWRNAYLFAAYELRQGTVKRGLGPAIDAQTINAIPTELIFDFLGVRLNGPRADGRRITLNWNFTDTKESYVLTLQNSTFTYTRDAQAPDADASLTSLRDNLNAILLRRSTLAAAIQSGQIGLLGETEKAIELFSLFDEFNPNFEIVEPKSTPN